MKNYLIDGYIAIREDSVAAAGQALRDTIHHVQAVERQDDNDTVDVLAHYISAAFCNRHPYFSGEPTSGWAATNGWYLFPTAGVVTDSLAALLDALAPYAEAKLACEVEETKDVWTAEHAPTHWLVGISEGKRFSLEAGMHYPGEDRLSFTSATQLSSLMSTWPTLFPPF